MQPGACDARAQPRPDLRIGRGGGAPRAPARVDRRPGAGPVKVITDQGVHEADAATGEMTLAALYPAVTADDVQAGVGWPLARRARLGAVMPPTETELRVLREVLDPRKLYLKG